MNPTIHPEWARARSANLDRRAEREWMALAAVAHPAIARAVAGEMVLAARRPRKQQARGQMLTPPLLARCLLMLLSVRRRNRPGLQGSCRNDGFLDAQDLPHGCHADAVAGPGEFPVHSAVSPPRILPR